MMKKVNALPDLLLPAGLLAVCGKTEESSRIACATYSDANDSGASAFGAAASGTSASGAAVSGPKAAGTAASGASGLGATALKAAAVLLLLALTMFFLTGCSSDSADTGTKESSAGDMKSEEPYTEDTSIQEVINDTVFGDYGRLIFPVDEGYMSGNTLGSLNLIWYHYIDPDKTVEIANYLHDEAASGRQVFYDIYSDEEKEADPAKEDTGLFFFKGDENGKTAVVNAGGGFAYVGAMQDSFPVSLELSKRGYNAFALIYRPGAQTACEDLSRAISFLYENEDELGIDMTDYSLWGGSAGARMANWVGTYGTAYFGEGEHPRPAIVVTQYSGISEVTGYEPPTYANVGTSDGIASYRTMQARIRAIQANGTDAEIEVFDGLPHGFGLGTGTAAEGWIEHAIAFWQAHMTT
jgi:acetyl esterase/lipase